jgi:hypothetical protein
MTHVLLLKKKELLIFLICVTQHYQLFFEDYHGRLRIGKIFKYVGSVHKSLPGGYRHYWKKTVDGSKCRLCVHGLGFQVFCLLIMTGIGIS